MPICGRPQRKLMWETSAGFRNEEYEEDDLSGASFPFFVGEVLSIDEEKSHCRPQNCYREGGVQ
jgi:hypothetical protein